MKQFITPIVILTLAVVLLSKATLDQVSGTNTTRDALESAEQQILIKNQSHQVKTIQLQTKIGSSSAKEIISTYGPTIASMRDISKVTQGVNKTAEELLIPIQEQKTSTDSAGGIRTHKYFVTIVSTFQDDLNWIGEIEDVYPLARVNEITMEPSGDLVTFKTSLQFPIINLNK